MKSVLLISILTLGLFFGKLSAQTSDNPLSYSFDRHYGQVEVGGRFAGAEFHEGRPLPSRISFYYPVANSIDLSTDYWKRGSSMPMVVGFRAGDSPKRWLGREAWDYTLSPHRTIFHRRESDLDIFISYEFCMNEPAMVMTLRIKNMTGQTIPIELYTHLALTLRTCQTYARKDSAWTEYDSTATAIIAHFDDPQTLRTSVFVQNASFNPTSWSSSASGLAVTDSGTSRWLTDSTSHLGKTLIPSGRMEQPVAAFIYRKDLDSYDSMSIVQIVGTCPRDEVKRRTSFLAAHWRNEVDAYDEFVEQKAKKESHFNIGDAWLDRSAIWARGLIATNAHYLDGAIVPMPCPAEYNFFFTHDLLLTDLGAVNFDLPRVKRDLMYVAAHARDKIIPHAYYWRDDGFKTEYCAPDNWNHLWFVQTSASYFRHSLDSTTVQSLYPLISTSIEQILTQRKEDGLMYAKHPDWWDIGNREGPRSYLTILTIRALREFVYVSAALKDRDSKYLCGLEKTANEMEKALSEKLWDHDNEFLTNFNGTDRDNHYYAGSLLAPFCGVLAKEKSEQLLETAKKQLVDEKIGVRIVAPVDFHTDSMISYFKLAGNEAGAPYIYANGGVWPHSTAWYILALHAIGRTDDAVQYLRRTLTLDGIANSPMGQPAMYEYRFADVASPEYGKIDKPSFLWAGGFYLNVLYRLFGVDENTWNLSVSMPRPSDFDTVSFSLAFGESKNVRITGKGKTMRSANDGNTAVASVVLPLSSLHSTQYTIECGRARSPYLESVNAILHSAKYVPRTKVLQCVITSFQGHDVIASVIGKQKVRQAYVDGKPIQKIIHIPLGDGTEKLELHFSGTDKRQILAIWYWSL